MSNFSSTDTEPTPLISQTQMVQVYRALLNILISKAGISGDLKVLIAPSLCAVLRQLESTTDVSLSTLLLDHGALTLESWTADR